jgi:hypothetical protein
LLLDEKFTNLLDSSSFDIIINHCYSVLLESFPSIIFEDNFISLLNLNLIQF